MRRIVGYQPLMVAVAVVLMPGCSNSPSPDLADGKEIAEAEQGIALPYASKSDDTGTDERAGDPARRADEPSAANSEKEPAPAEIADGADSDAPGGYQSLAADEAAISPSAAAQPLDQQAAVDETTKGNGRRSDGDDPAAALLIPKIAESQDEAALNNGREASAQPIPEGQRVAVAQAGDAAEPLEAGRTPNAKPGAEAASPVQAKPTIKPAAPSRETLSDLPQSIQALDKDGDGQLGLYEWPRAKLAEFKKLDSNKDGFLTPTELVAGQKKLSETESTSSGKEPATSQAEKSDEKTATKTDRGSQPDDAEGSAADATDKTETPNTTADEADNTDSSSDDEKPEQGS